MSKGVSRRAFFGVIRRAAPAAASWFEDLAGTYAGGSEERLEFSAIAKAVAGLATLDAAALGRQSPSLIMRALAGAEDWERWLYDTLRKSDPVMAREALRKANRYREVRLATLGPTKLEVAMERATPVNIQELMRRQTREPAQ